MTWALKRVYSEIDMAEEDAGNEGSVIGGESRKVVSLPKIEPRLIGSKADSGSTDQGSPPVFERRDMGTPDIKERADRMKEEVIGATSGAQSERIVIGEERKIVEGEGKSRDNTLEESEELSPDELARQISARMNNPNREEVEEFEKSFIRGAIGQVLGERGKAEDIAKKTEAFLEDLRRA